MKVRRGGAPWIAALVAALCGHAAAADEVAPGIAAYVTLSSGYWRHGLAHTDGASLQVGVDYQHRSGLFAYGRVMNVEYPQNLPGQERNVEASGYVGYHRRYPSWSWTVSAGRYVYPSSDGYDYGEWSASVGFRERVFYMASYSENYYARGGVSALNQELAAAFPLPSNFEIGAGIGYFDVRGGGPKITHWNLGASKLLGRMALDLRYYDANYALRNYLGDSTGDRLVLSLSYAAKRK